MRSRERDTDALLIRPDRGTTDLPLFGDRLERAKPVLHHGIDTSQARERTLRAQGKYQRDILNYLIAHGPRTRRELSDEASIDIATVCSTVAALRQHGFAVETGAKRNGGRLLAATPGRAAA